MKKHLLLLVFLVAGFSLSAQTVITGWSFPVNSGTDSLNANIGLPGNLGYDIRFEGTDTAYDVIYFAEGATDYAAAAKGWDNGADAKYWSIKFKAADYSNFKVCSKQYSTDSVSPRDFKLQWKISGGDFADVPSGAITVSNDWTTGVLDSLPVPVTGQGTSSIYLRWIMSSNTSINGGVVTADGETRIDDITVTATSSLGNKEIVFSNRLSLSPNPNHGVFNVTSTVPMKEVRIFDLTGKTITTAVNPGSSLAVDRPGLPAGAYFISVQFNDQAAWYTSKFIVD